MSYELGFFISLLLWLWHAVALLVHINSRFERNLNRVGQRLSWATLTPKPMTAEDTKRPLARAVGKYLLIVGFSLPFVLLSWVNVALYVAMYFYRRAKDAGVPQSVRELRWKMRNLDMGFDDLIKESMKVSEVDASTFNKVRAELIAEMEARGLDRRRLAL
jgi:hypothetical protein